MRIPTRVRFGVLCWGAVLTALACERPTEPISDVLTLESAWTAPATLYAPYAFVETVPRVRVLDQLGRPVSGVRVTFLALRAPDFPFVREVRSDRAGYAELDTLWRLGRTAGVQSLSTYLVSGQSGEPVDFSVTVGPGAAQRIGISRDSVTNVPVGDTTQIVGTYRDAYGNAVAGGAPISLSSGTPSVLSVGSNGTAIGLAAGPAWVVAQGGGFRDSTRMFVGPSLTVLRTDFPANTGIVTPQGTVFGSNWSALDQRAPLAGGLKVLMSNGDGFSDFAYSSTENVVWRVGESYTGLRALSPVTGALLRSVGAGGPYIRIALHPNGSDAFASQNIGTLNRINTATGAVTASPPLNGYLNGIALDVSRGLVFVSRTGDGRVFKLSMSTLGIVDSTLPGAITQAIALSPDGNRLFVARADGVEVLDPATFAVLGRLSGVTNAYDIAISQKGRAVIVTQNGPGKVWVFDLITLALRFEAVASAPRRILVDPVSHDGIILDATNRLYRLRPR